MSNNLRKVVAEILRTFVSERLQMTNVSWRSRSNRPTRELRRSRSVAQAAPPIFLPYTAFVQFANVHVLLSASFCCGNMSEPGSDQHHSRVPIRKAADNPGTAANLFHDAFETVICSQPAPVLIREIHIGQCLLHAGFYKTCDPLQLHGSFSATSAAFCRAAALSF